MRFTLGSLATSVPFVLCVATFPLAAQQPPSTTGSPSAQPAPIQRPAPAPAATAPAAPRPAGADERKVVVQRFEFSGNTVFSPEQLAAIVAGYTNREITLSGIYEAADAVASHYHRAGYNLAYVAPPAQRLTEGVVRLEVIEGRVGAVQVEGNRSYDSARIERYLGELQAGQIYRLEDLDGGLRRINALPGLNARATLRPGTTYGTSDLLINAAEKRVGAGLVVDNYGRENIGVYRATLSGAFNNPLRYGDQLQLLYMHSEDGGNLDYAYLGYNAPIGYSGLRGQVSYAEAQFTTSTGTSGVEVEGSNRTARLGVEYPFENTRTDTSAVTLAVTNQQSDADIAGVALTNTVDLSLLELGYTNSHVFENYAMYQNQFTLASNFQSYDAAACDGNTANGEDCNSQMLRAEGDFQLVLPLVGRLDTFARVNAVYSPDPLPPVSPFSLGGPNSVRGYATSEVRGDQGAFATIALRVGVPLGAVQAQFRVFGDSGVALRVDPGIGTTERDSLTSAGAGLDLFWQRNTLRLSGKVDWSKPLDSHVSSDGDDDRVFASVSMGF